VGGEENTVKNDKKKKNNTKTTRFKLFAEAKGSQVGKRVKGRQLEASPGNAGASTFKGRVNRLATLSIKLQEKGDAQKK